MLYIWVVIYIGVSFLRFRWLWGLPRSGERMFDSGRGTGCVLNFSHKLSDKYVFIKELTSRETYHKKP